MLQLIASTLLADQYHKNAKMTHIYRMLIITRWRFNDLVSIAVIIPTLSYLYYLCIKEKYTLTIFMTHISAAFSFIIIISTIINTFCETRKKQLNDN